MQNIGFLHLICYHKLKNGENGAFENWLQRWDCVQPPKWSQPTEAKVNRSRGKLNFLSYLLSLIFSSNVFFLLSVTKMMFCYLDPFPHSFCSFSLSALVTLDDFWLNHALLGVLLHQLHAQGLAAELGHGLPQRWIQEHLAHHVSLQGGGVALQVGQKLLPGEGQVVPEHINVQIEPRWRERVKKNVFLKFKGFTAKTSFIPWIYNSITSWWYPT